MTSVIVYAEEQGREGVEADAGQTGVSNVITSIACCKS
jgi:hypothetical protein